MRWRGWRAGRLRAEEERPPTASRAQSREESLPAGLRARAERSLGVPLSTVRMLRGEGAAGIARQQSAHAVTDGETILSAPSADEGTLAHELVHVAQFRRSEAAGDGVGAPGDASEREASRLAPAVLAGIPVGGGVRAPPSAGIQRDALKPDTSKPASRARLTGRDLAGYAPTSKDWESQFDPQVLAPDPSVAELKRNYAARRAADPGLPDKTGIDLAQEWAADLTDFKKREARRYKIDQLLEQMIRELPDEIWLPDAGVISQGGDDKSSLTVTGTKGPYSGEPLRNKLYTLLAYMRDIKVETDPTGLIWDDALSWSRVDRDPTEQPQPFRLDYEPFTRIEDSALRTFFGAEMKEWSRRAVAVDERAQREKNRRQGLVAAGVAAAAEKFVYVGLGASAAIGLGAGLVPAGLGATSELGMAGALRFTPRLAFWALTHPHATLGIALGGAGLAHDIGAGEFSVWSLLHLVPGYAGYYADEGNLAPPPGGGGGGGGAPPAPAAGGEQEPSPAAPSPAPVAEEQQPAGKPAPPPAPAAPQAAAAPDSAEVEASSAPRPAGLSRPMLANMPWLRNILVSLRMGVANAIPATAGTGGGGGSVGDRPVPALTIGGQATPTAPVVDAEVTPGTGVGVSASPASATAPSTAPGAPAAAAPASAPAPAAPAAQLPAAPAPAIAAPTLVVPGASVTSPAPSQQGSSPAAQQPGRYGRQTNAESQRGVARDQRSWMQELFGGNFTSGLRDVLGRVWNRVGRAGDRAAILSAAGRQQYVLATRFYNLQRARFWRAVRVDPDARALIEAAGGQFLGGDTSAPVIVLPDGTRLEITIDHNIQRKDDPRRALDADNLSLSSRRENTVVLRLLHVLDPFVNIPPHWQPFDPDEEP